MQQSARVMGIFTPGRGVFCDWQELDNKFEAFRLFQYADRELGPAAAHLPINDLVSRALALDAFRAIWILEGVGHSQGLARPLSAKGLLTDGTSASLPDCAMVPLHAGMGTAFAEKLFARLDSNPTAGAVQHTVESFLDACRVNCRPGWGDACMEPVGLVVRCLYPSLLNAVSGAMEQVNPALRRLFWHGVGRSLYFVPTNFMPIPGAQERMFINAISEPSCYEDKQNVVAGLAWALTLVNLRQPAIVRPALPLCSRLHFGDECTNGMISALLLWRHMAPAHSRYLGDYIRLYAPVRDALVNFYPGLERNNNIPALYTYRTSEELGALSA